jgi:hypothetical protein
VSKLCGGLLLIRHDDDGGHQEEDTDGVLRVEGGVLEVQLQDKVQDDLEAPEDVGLAWADPSEIATTAISIARTL